MKKYFDKDDKEILLDDTIGYLDNFYKGKIVEISSEINMIKIKLNNEENSYINIPYPHEKEEISLIKLSSKNLFFKECRDE